MVDEETVSRAGLVAILAADPSIALVGTAVHLQDALSIIRRQRPNVIVVTIDHLREADPEALGRSHVRPRTSYCLPASRPLERTPTLDAVQLDGRRPLDHLVAFGALEERHP